MGIVNAKSKAVVDAEKAEQTLKSKVAQAMQFGQKLMQEFIEENVSMGITQDNMSEAVLDAMEKVEPAVRTGTLYVAISRIKAIPAESKDAKYITDARLLSFVNKIEEYLEIPLSDTL